MNKKAICFWSCVIILLGFSYLNKSSYNSEKIVNVYGWYGVIPREVLKDFEKETGIKVVYDLYDDNNTLEAKLLATNSGYDVVFPSFIPNAARQVKMGVYQKLDFKLLPNIKNMDGVITDKFKEAKGDINYILPMLWETIGISFNGNLIRKIFPNEKIDTYDILLNPEKIKKLYKYGVSFPEEYVDIFPQTMRYLKIPSTDYSKIESIKKCKDHFKGIRKYITKFSSTTMISDLLSGDVCIAIGPSDNSFRAIQAGPNVGKNIEYILPKDAGILVIDCAGIPNGAPHTVNAHKFLNYIMTPEVAAKITNFSGMPMNIPSAVKLFNKQITDNKQVCPSDPEVLKSLVIGLPSESAEDVKCVTYATRAWSQIRMNTFKSIKEVEKND